MNSVIISPLMLPSNEKCSFNNGEIKKLAHNLPMCAKSTNFVG